MNNTGKMTFLAGADLEANRRVKIKAGSTTQPLEVVYAVKGDDKGVGTVEYNEEAGRAISIRLNNDSGSRLVCASKALTVGTEIYSAGDGKVSDVSIDAGSAIGLILESASEADDFIEAILY